MSIGKLCRKYYTFTFTKNELQVAFNGKVILTRKRFLPNNSSEKGTKEL